ncbi:TetR/AcrR family transcriptional regulator [Flectobacillus roseus]|uniref:TetR/AcrR family transcriptional regulator n=1 Tax=Flectobacillus roseus TaxID=502259 RepID=A0ABT6YFL8_9BACT|nr:TetR/AcrR family transcriptional regulator [Flectobacillus roseus]MDI9862399.1 TetR/AcrR family transcriptional regulator [Flectobacillus roseus]MDI9871641.1 TetR/AcrR family transcriptional regulator [Flectobacillus roseus]
MTDTLQKDEIIIKEVIDAAKVLFQRYGLKKTTMEDIAKFVGKGKSTLYYYFPSKIEIFEAVIENEIRELFESIEIAASKEVTARQKLKVYWLTRLQKLEKMCNLSQVLKEEIMDHAITIFNLKRKHLHEELTLVKGFLIFGIENEEFRPETEEHIEVLCRVIVASLRGFELSNMEVFEIEKDYIRHIDFLIDTFISGIGIKSSSV